MDNRHSGVVGGSTCVGAVEDILSDRQINFKRLLLSILDKYDGYYKFCVFSSLASIGTAESLLALKSKLAYFNYPSGGGGDVVVSLEQPIESIEKRINANQRQAASKNRRQDASPGSQNSDGKVSTETNSGLKRKSSDDRNSMNQWLVWGGVILGVMILLLRFIQRRAT